MRARTLELANAASRKKQKERRNRECETPMEVQSHTMSAAAGITSEPVVPELFILVPSV
jgi:hypothetical protein